MEDLRRQVEALQKDVVSLRRELQVRDARIAELEAELKRRTFHARSDTISYDESKELYILRSFGKRKATVWRQLKVGGKSSRQTGRRIEFSPSRNILKIDGATGFDGIQ